MGLSEPAYAANNFAIQRFRYSVVPMNQFNEETDLLLIKAVQQHRIIYDSDHAKYADSITREKAWRKIAAVLNKPSKLCKSRWINMRDALRRKVMNNRQPGAKKSRNYKYEKEMSFVKMHFKDVVHCFRDNDSVDYLAKKEASAESDGESSGGGAFEFQNVHPSPSDSLNESDYLQARADPVPAVETASVEPFLASIGATLRQLTPYYLNQAKTKIFQVVQEYELAQIVEKGGRPSSTTLDRTVRE